MSTTEDKFLVDLPVATDGANTNFYCEQDGVSKQISVDILNSGLSVQWGNIGGTITDQTDLINYISSNQYTNEDAQDAIATAFAAGTQTLITINYNDAGNSFDFTVDNDLANYDNTNSQFATTSQLHDPVTLAGPYDYLTLSGQEITLGQIDLTTDVVDRLPHSNFATGTAHSVVGRAGTGNGDVGNITAGNNTVLRRSGSGDVAFGDLDVSFFSDINMDVTNGVVYWDGDSLETSTGITWDGSYLNLTTPIDFSDTVGDKILWFDTAYATGIEAGTLYHRAATRHRKYIGGTTPGSGTNVFELDANNLSLGVNVLLSSGHSLFVKTGNGIFGDGDGSACLVDFDFTDIGTDATQSEWRYFRDSNFSAGGTYPRIMVHRADGTFNPRFEMDCNDGNFTVYAGDIYASAGRLGIGTTTPSSDGGTGFQASIKNSSNQYLLYLASTSASGDMMLAFGQSNTRTAYIQYLDSGDLFRITNEYGPLVFLTGTSGAETEKLRLETSGNLTVKSNSNFLKDSGVTWYVGATGSGTSSDYNTTMIPQNMGTQKLWVGQASTIGTVVGQCFVGFGKGLTTYAGSGLPSVTNTIYAYYGSLTKSTAEGGTMYAQYNNLQDLSSSGTGAYLEGVYTNVIRSGTNTGSLTGYRARVRATNSGATVPVLTGFMTDTASNGSATNTLYAFRVSTDASTYTTAYSFYNPNNWRMVQAGAATIGSTGSQRQELTVYDNGTGVDYLQASIGTTGSIGGLEIFNSTDSFEFQAFGDDFFLYHRTDSTYALYYEGTNNRWAVGHSSPSYTLDVLNGTIRGQFVSNAGNAGITKDFEIYDSFNSVNHAFSVENGIIVTHTET